MTHAEYAEYEAAYARGLDGFNDASSGGCVGCQECCEEYGYDHDTEELLVTPEPYFSKSACDLCGSTLGGNREPAHALNADNEIVHLDVCVDCVYYSEYGRLDDTTMADLEN